MLFDCFFFSLGWFVINCWLYDDIDDVWMIKYEVMILSLKYLCMYVIWFVWVY